MFIQCKKGPRSVRRKAFPPTTRVFALPFRSVVELQRSAKVLVRGLMKFVPALA